VAADGGGGVVVGVPGAEQHGADLGAPVQGEGGVGVDEVGEGAGAVADGFDQGTEAVAAECSEGDGDLEDVRTAGGAQ
jgi:hypothetical protein